MKFLLFEWMVGGGLIESNGSPDRDDPFFQQGSAMFSAMAADLIAAGHDVVAPLDERVFQLDSAASWTQKCQHFQPHPLAAELWQTLRRLAVDVDQILLIAPESDGILTQCYRELKAFKAKWFGGPLDWIELASNKNRMQEYLIAKDISVPPNVIAAGKKWVAKPVDGAGSDDVQVFTGAGRLKEFRDHQKWRVEQFVTGKSVSLSVVQFGGNVCFLPPTGQVFAGSEAGQNSKPGRSIGAYIGTKYPLEESLADRSTALARQTVSVLPKLRGYIGIDMVLADDGPDVVIEINPRMTMSYCHLPLELRRRWLDRG